MIQMFVVVQDGEQQLKLKAYIEKNYTVNGGNYFRKNADGSVGDDVSAVHSSSSNQLHPDDQQCSKRQD